jgi:hypothetical protein
MVMGITSVAFVAMSVQETSFFVSDSENDGASGFAV